MIKARTLANGKKVYDVRLRDPSAHEYCRTFPTKKEANARTPSARASARGPGPIFAGPNSPWRCWPRSGLSRTQRSGAGPGHATTGLSRGTSTPRWGLVPSAP